MKATLRIVATLLLAGVLLLKVLPVLWLQKLPLLPAKDLLALLRPELLPIEEIAAAPPAPIVLDNPAPLWQGEAEKQRRLLAVARFGPIEARQNQVRLNQLNFLAAADSFVAVVDVPSHDVLIFSPMLTLIRRWHMTSGLAEVIRQPVALAARGDEIAALGADGTVAWWDTFGTRRGGFKVAGMVNDLIILPDGSFLVEQTTPAPYLLRIYSRRGHERKRFAAMPAADSSRAAYLHLAYIARSRQGEITLGFIHPYRLLFLDPNLRPRRLLEINPPFPVQPPDFQYRDGQIIRMVRQSVIYDLAWHDRQLYVLVATGDARAAVLMDVFDRDGQFLQRFYLATNVLKMAFYRDDLLMLSSWPNYRIERLRIAPFHGD